MRPGPVDRVLRTAARVSSRGPGEVAALARARAREWVRSDEQLMMLVRATAADTPSFPHDPMLRLRVAHPDDGDLYARVIGTDSAATFRRRLTARTRCFLVEAAGQLLHSSWVTTSAAWTREIRAFVVPPHGDAYVYESFTLVAARGRGVYPFALSGICAWAAEAGLHNVWVAVESGNASSLKAIRKAGFEPSYTLRYRRHLGRLRLEAAPPAGVTAPEVVRDLPA